MVCWRECPTPSQQWRLLIFYFLSVTAWLHCVLCSWKTKYNKLQDRLWCCHIWCHDQDWPCGLLYLVSQEHSATKLLQTKRKRAIVSIVGKVLSILFETVSEGDVNIIRSWKKWKKIREFWPKWHKKVYWYWMWWD